MHRNLTTYQIRFHPYYNRWCVHRDQFHHQSRTSFSCKRGFSLIWYFELFVNFWHRYFLHTYGRPLPHHIVISHVDGVTTTIWCTSPSTTLSIAYVSQQPTTLLLLIRFHPWKIPSIPWSLILTRMRWIVLVSWYLTHDLFWPYIHQAPSPKPQTQGSHPRYYLFSTVDIFSHLYLPLTQGRYSLIISLYVH